MNRNHLTLTNVWASPIEFKGISIHPVRLKDCEQFFEYVKCLMLEKNKYKDASIIKMSYLKFLVLLAGSGHDYLLDFLEHLLLLVTKSKPILEIENQEKIVLKFPIQARNNELNNYSILTEMDFDKVRKIIFEQNLIQLEKEILSPELEKKISEARTFMERKNGKMADLEQQIIAYHCAFQLSYKEISELTIYQFQKGLQRMNLIKEAKAIQNAKYSGLISFKDDTKLPNWLSYIEDINTDDQLFIRRSEFDKFANEKGLIHK